MPKTISANLRVRIRIQAQNRCGYCLARQEYIPWDLEIEHIIPRSKGGTDNEDNLWCACRICNARKSNHTHGVDPLTRRRIRLFNPRRQSWRRHFRWSDDGVLIIGQTACGRATVITLDLNNLVAVTVRRNWVAAGWHPPQA